MFRLARHRLLRRGGRMVGFYKNPSGWSFGFRLGKVAITLARAK